MKKYFLIIIAGLFALNGFSQTQPRKLVGIDLVTNMPRYYNDTLRTITYKPPLYVVGDSVYLDTSHLGLWALDSLGRIYRNSNVGINTINPKDYLQIDDSAANPSHGMTLNATYPTSLTRINVSSPLLRIGSRVWLTSLSKDSLVQMYLQTSGSSSSSVPNYQLNFFNNAGTAVATLDYLGSLTTANVNTGRLYATGNGQFLGNVNTFGTATSVPGSLVTMTSTTLGYAPPRLTTAQINASAYLLGAYGNAGIITNSGSGYTPGTYTAIPMLSLDRGSNPTATIVVSGGGIVTSVYLSGGTTGSIVGGRLTCPTLPGGSGFLYTITTLVGTTGVELYNTTNNVSMVLNGFDMVQRVLSYYRAITSATTLTNTDWTIDCTTGTFTVTLPTAVGILGRPYTIINSGSGSITLATTSSQTIGNTSSDPTSITIGAGNSYSVISTNSNWRVTSKF